MVDHDAPSTPSEDTVARAAAASYDVAHAADEATHDDGARRRALAERLAAGPRSRTTTTAPARRRRPWTIAAAVGLVAAAAAMLLSLRIGAPPPGASTGASAPAAYHLELGGDAVDLGTAGPRWQQGASLVLRARPGHPVDAPVVRTRWADDRSELRDLSITHEHGGAVIVRATIERPPGRHTLEVLLGADGCTWDRPQAGCEQLAVDLEVDR